VSLNTKSVIELIDLYNAEVAKGCTVIISSPLAMAMYNPRRLTLLSEIRRRRGVEITQDPIYGFVDLNTRDLTSKSTLLSYFIDYNHPFPGCVSLKETNVTSNVTNLGPVIGPFVDAGILRLANSAEILTPLYKVIFGIIGESKETGAYYLDYDRDSIPQFSIEYLCWTDETTGELAKLPVHVYDDQGTHFINVTFLAV